LRWERNPQAVCGGIKLPAMDRRIKSGRFWMKCLNLWLCFNSCTYMHVVH
jgi:hypothetical protein